MNPFFSYSDNRNFFSGNPLLKPEYTNSYELNFLNYFENATLTTGVYFRQTSDVISRIRRIGDDLLFVTKPENLGTKNDFGAEVNVSYNTIKWMRLNGNANFFRSITSAGTQDLNLDADTYGFRGRISARLSFWKSDLQVNTNYRSAIVTPQGRRQGITSIDLGWSKDFLAKKNLTLTLSVRDLLNSRRRRYETFGENFYSQGEFQWRSRTITLAANYRINQRKSRGGKNREGGGDFEGGGF